MDNTFLADALRRIKQLVIEFHGVNDDSWNSRFAKKRACLEKLATTHYLVHAHGNNYAARTGDIPDVIELTYVRKDCFATPPVLSTSSCPVAGLDFPNNPHAADFSLACYPFLHK